MVKNKLLIICLIAISFILIFTFNDKVSAIFQVESFNNDTTFYNLPDLPDKPEKTKATLITLETVNDIDYFYLYYLTYETEGYDPYFAVYKENDNSYSLYACCSFYFRDFYYSCPTNDLSSWSTVKGGSQRRGYVVHLGTYNSNSGSVKDILYSDTNIYVATKQSVGSNFKLIPTDEIFFHKASTWKVNLFKVRQLEEILPMVNKLVTILMKVGLRVFSVLLVVYLIASKKWLRF